MLCCRLPFFWASSDGQGLQLGNTSALRWRHYTESFFIAYVFRYCCSGWHFTPAETVGYSLHEYWNSGLLTSRILKQWDTHFTNTETVGYSLHEYWNSGIISWTILRHWATQFTNTEIMGFSLHEYWNSGILAWTFLRHRATQFTNTEASA